MTAIIAHFLNDETGAVTVDWVVLTAGILLLAIGVVAPIGSNVTNSSNSIGAYVGSMTIATY